VKKARETFSILVLRGGPSAEREVSLSSGQAVAAALKARGHVVYESDIGPDDLAVLDRIHVDVVFPVLHGTFGEDGQLQAILEKRGLRYVGSNAASSRLAMDKWLSKQAVEGAGVLTAEGVLLEAGKGAGTNEIERAIGRVGIPCVAKPNCQGSSIGVVIGRTKLEAWEGIERSLEDYGDCLVEKFIAGRELTVGILGDKTLPILEIKPAEGFYDYQAKYVSDNTEYSFETGLPLELTKQIQDQARRAFMALGCRDLGRVDFILDGQGRSYFLEVNTLPGFTSHSLVPKAAGRIGLSFEEMCEEIVRMSLARPI